MIELMNPITRVLYDWITGEMVFRNNLMRISIIIKIKENVNEFV